MLFNGPNPNVLCPLDNYINLIFLKNAITRSNIKVGDYTYYDDFVDPQLFEKQNVLYHFDFIGDQLIIGKFCAIAAGVKFMMNGANHEIKPISTYPFALFFNGWETVNEGICHTNKYPFKGDTIVGNDVWFGHDSLVMPGVRIGNGAIIATRSVVTRDVPDYAVVGGNPARLIRHRFCKSDVERLQRIAWWDWPVEKITKHLRLINSADLNALEAVNV